MKFNFLYALVGIIAPIYSAFSALNTIHINMPQDQFNNFAAPARASARKLAVSGAQISINGQPYQPLTLTTRGQTCIGSARRCYGVEYKTDVALNMDNGKPWETDGFNLSSMYEDTGYINNKIGYGLSEKIGLATVKTTYAEVIFNGRSQGLYLVAQKPQKVAKKLKSGIIIRRREEGFFEVKKFYPEFAKYSELKYKTTLEELYRFIENDPEDNQLLYKKVLGRIHMPQYFRLLTLQSLLMSGDYSDEVYFYARPGIDGLAFDVMGWDFEDLFTVYHDTRANNRARRRGYFDNSIMYSFEDPLDKAIRLNPKAHAQLKVYAKKLLTEVLTEQVLKKQIDEVIAAITPYLDNQNIMAMSVYDSFNRTAIGVPRYSKEAILNLLQKRYSQMISRRQVLLNRL